MKRSTRIVCLGARRRRTSFVINKNNRVFEIRSIRGRNDGGIYNNSRGLVTQAARLGDDKKDVSNNNNSREGKKRYGHIEELVNLVNGKLGSGKVQLKEVLNTVWNEDAITAQCRDFIIRLTSLRGEVSKAVWEMRGGNPDEVQILAVGTTAIPNHIPQLLQFFDNFYTLSTKHYRNSHAIGTSDSFPEIGYDLLSKGSEASRRSVLALFNEHYGFNSATIDQFVKSSAITSGGMRGLKDLADAMMLNCPAPHKHRFIQPDNSFGTWWNIIESTTPLSAHRREVFNIPTSQANSLHLTAEDVNKHYAANPAAKSESWYITPVGNPSGTRMTREQLLGTLNAVFKHNPQAVIVLDSVYVRTLTRPAAKELFSCLIPDNTNNTISKELLNQIVFVESFSKSHGLCRERLGIYSSTNSKLFTLLHTANIGFSAGPGDFKDAQMLTLGTLVERQEEKKGVDSLHQFWQKERKGLWKYLVKGQRAKERGWTDKLWDKDQSHVKESEMNEPLGLYLLLKAKEGVKAQDIFVETGILGVDTKMGSGHYVRFSVGKLQQPVFSKYAEEN